MLSWEMGELLIVEVVVQILVNGLDFFQHIALSVVAKVLNGECPP